jgi:WD40 repeat protein/tRNA A-37 threonylcarbamoyl transferase component Bud32
MHDLVPPTRSALAPGRVVVQAAGGRFTILREHARGGLGQVSLARDEKLKREVALKEILPDKRDNAYLRQRFLNEAEITGQLEHPGIVPIYDLEQDADGQVRYAMRFIQGRTLQEAVRDYHAGPTPLGFRDLFQRFVSVCQTIAYAHSQGVIHRDLKPANIILGNYGETLVVDWGLAKRLRGPAGEVQETVRQGEKDSAPVAVAADPLTETGQVMGTLTYMAPEQAAGDLKSVGTPADIFSLGAILYTLLTGQSPYQRMKREEVFAAVRQGSFPRPREIHPGVPRTLEAICLKALAAEIPGRYASAADLAGDLDRWLADESVAVYREPWYARLGRWLRRHQALATGAGALLLTGVIALAISTLLVSNAEQRTHEALGKEEQAHQETEAALRESRLVAAGLALDRGLALGDQGNAALGMHWFLRGMDLLPPDEKALHAVLLANLAAWRGSFSVLRGRLQANGAVSALAVTKDGRTIVAGTTMREGWLWDVATGQPLGGPLAHPGQVATVAISPDDKYAVTGCRGDAKLRFWDMQTRQAVAVTTRHTAPILAIAFRPDGKVLATGSGDGTAQLWDAETRKPIGAPIRHARGHPVEFALFRADGKQLLTAGRDGRINIWDAVTGKAAASELNLGAPITALAGSPDAKRLLVASFLVTFQWDVAAGKRMGDMVHGADVHAVAFSPDGKTAASAGVDGTVNLWAVADSRPAFQPLSHSRLVLALAFTGDGRHLIAGGNDGVHVWELAAGQQTPVPFTPGPNVKGMMSKPVLHPDGQQWAVPWNRGWVQLADAATGQLARPVRQIGYPVIRLAFSPDGKQLALGSGGGGAQLYDPGDWTARGPKLSFDQVVALMAFADHGRLLLTGGLNKVGDSRLVQAWDTATGKPVGPPLKHPHQFMALGAARDGPQFVTGSIDGVARLWDADSGQLRQELKHDGSVDVVALSDDGSRVATGIRKSTYLWDAASGRLLGVLPLDDKVNAMVFSADGRFLITASSDGTARLWDVATGKRVGPLRQHGAGVMALGLSPDGRLLRTFSLTSQLHTWPLSTDIPDEPARLTLWVQTLTGQELRPDGTLQSLSAATWRERDKQLTTMGGASLP